MTRWALPLAVLLGLAVAWAAAQPPRPRGADTSPDAFSAARAMADVRVIARTPHPVGSPENAAVRDHLVSRLTALGLQPQVRPGERDGVRFENVAGRLPGADRAAPALLMMAHYDSVPGSPGAADDASGVAAILEAVRAYQATAVRPRRDVVVLLTDGEEAGLYGARAFFADPATARAIGAVLNFESRGGGGRVQMFETGADNGAMIRAYGRSVGSPSANSLMRFVYDRMPNGTDFTIPKRQEIAGLNFAFIGDEAAYHTPLSTPERLDQGSLQHMGDQALSLLTALAGAPALPSRAGDAVYSDVFGLTLVAYPPDVGWWLLILTALLLNLAYDRTRAVDTGEGVGRRLAVLGGGGLRLLLGAVLAGVLLHLAHRLLPLGTPAAIERAPWLLAAFSGLIAVGLVVAHLRLRRTAAAGFGALIVGLLVATVLQAVAPETAFVFAWPALLGAATLLALTFAGQAGPLIAVISAAFGLGWIFGLLHLLFLGVGQFLPEALALGALLIPLVLYPTLTLRRASPPPSRTALAGPRPA